MSNDVTVTFNPKDIETIKVRYYQEMALDTIVGTGDPDRGTGNFLVELDADHVGVNFGVHFSIQFNHMINYYCHFKYHSGSSDSQQRDWAIKELLGTEQYQKLVNSNNPTEIVKVDLYQYVHNVLYLFEDE